jgi:hypothetical protein
MNETSTAKSATSDLGRLMQFTVDPLLQLCNISASDLPKLEHSVYMINSLNWMIVRLYFSFTSRKSLMNSLLLTLIHKTSGNYHISIQSYLFLNNAENYSSFLVLT